MFFLQSAQIDALSEEVRKGLERSQAELDARMELSKAQLEIERLQVRLDLFLASL